MSANRIFLVCSHHPSIDEALLIAERGEHAIGFEAADFNRAAKWFERHATCGKPDDFQIAFHRPQNHDVIETPVAKEVPAAVQLALVNGSKQ